MSEKSMRDGREVARFDALDDEAMRAAYREGLAGVGFSDEAKARMKAGLRAKLAAGVRRDGSTDMEVPDPIAARPAEILHLRREEPGRVVEASEEVAGSKGTGSVRSSAPAASVAAATASAAGLAAAPASAVTVSASTGPTTTAMRTPASRRVRSARPYARWAVAAGLAAALILGGGGVAVATGAITVPLPTAVADLFGGKPADTEIVKKVGRPVGASATSNGVTITADAIVGDASNIKVLYTIAREDGKPFDIPAGAKTEDGLLMVGFSSPGTDIEGASGMGGGSYFYDADPTDNKIQYVEEWSVDASGSLIGKTMHVDVRDLMVYSGTYESDVDAAVDQVLAKGEWKLDFKIDYKDSSRPLGEGIELDQNGMKATVKRASISPVGFTIEYVVDGAIDDSKIGSDGMMTDEANAELEKFFDQDYVVTMKDGSQIKASNTGGSSHKESGKEVVKRGFFFDNIIDVDQVESVTVNGTELPFV